ncbi:hypothetical protein PIB30_025491 [Stylosanthes scabra]|uniref:Uncharacterized protein n=1 Tax=Stylosanthes scabra TaxID=79078 RepID=A0ABU6X8F5_9FABA|nr:hypothetical protein [Stylosanthes scabra]
MCQKEAQNLLSTADGEYIMYADRGRVTNLKKNNEYEHSSELSKKSTQNGQRLLKDYELADLMDLAKTNKVKKLEFTKTRRVRMSFNEENKDGPPQNWYNKKAQQGPNKNNNTNHIGHCCRKTGSNAKTSPTYVGHGPCPNSTNVCSSSQNNASKENGEGTSNVDYNHHNYLEDPYGYGNHYTPYAGTEPQSQPLPPPQPTPTLLVCHSCIIM